MPGSRFIVSCAICFLRSRFASLGWDVGYFILDEELEVLELEFLGEPDAVWKGLKDGVCFEKYVYRLVCLNP